MRLLFFALASAMVSLCLTRESRAQTDMAQRTLQSYFRKNAKPLGEFANETLLKFDSQELEPLVLVAQWETHRNTIKKGF